MMKKIISFLIFSLFISMPTAQAATGFEKNLFYGITGSDDVIQLQEFLTDQKLYTGPITGNFYSLTKKAVVAFQKAHGISGTGYFGPLTRVGANKLLGPIVDESGEPVTAPSTPAATTNDVTTKLADQITKLQEQLLQLQQQNQTLSNIQQQAKQTQVLQQIQQDTTPPPLFPPPQVIKELKIETEIHNFGAYHVGQAIIKVRYYENGAVKDSVVTLSADEGEILSFTNGCTGGEAANSDGSQRKGDPITCPTRLSGNDGKPEGYFGYTPTNVNAVTKFNTSNGIPIEAVEVVSRTITAIASGITKSITIDIVVNRYPL